MPHCVIDFSANVVGADIASRLTQACHGAMLSSGLFEPASVKTRAHLAQSALTGEGNDSFIHVTIAIMPGRSSEKKHALMEAMVYAIAKAGISASSLTLEVRELDKANYVKKLA
ncbi:5-carboxymethyl-2-hydroxymuconate Delta-isomerase [Shewanella sp.]|uniref:5-carboxymethyl-2-hydroxymuconate Delta-isomerase n=1 Tax=Shewanella sp. TaxID=50422 RepID=UPI003563FAFE